MREPASALREQLSASLAEADKLVKKLTQLADEADRLVQGMDFRFLYNRSRKLLSIGCDAQSGAPMAGCYDLLASEARSAIFRGDCQGRHTAGNLVPLGANAGFVARAGRPALLERDYVRVSDARSVVQALPAHAARAKRARGRAVPDGLGKGKGDALGHF